MPFWESNELMVFLMTMRIYIVTVLKAGHILSENYQVTSKAQSI